jgi:hypothetical protein
MVGTLIDYRGQPLHHPARRQRIVENLKVVGTNIGPRVQTPNSLGVQGRAAVVDVEVALAEDEVATGSSATSVRSSHSGIRIDRHDSQSADRGTSLVVSAPLDIGCDRMSLSREMEMSPTFTPARISAWSAPMVSIASRAFRRSSAAAVISATPSNASYARTMFLSRDCRHLSTPRGSRVDPQMNCSLPHQYQHTLASWLSGTGLHTTGPNRLSLCCRR